MSKFFTADLHIHTVLSPCAETEMLPEFIVERAQELGLNLIAVTDHNSAENAVAVINAAQDSGVTVLPGMEVQSREEAHIVCLFDQVEQALLWQAEVYAHLPPLKNRENVFGAQILLDANGQAIGTLDRLLSTSVSFSVEEIVRRVCQLGGICIPAHIDRPAYSLIANLGFIPPDLDIHGVEISHLIGVQEARTRFPQLKRYGIIGSGDAHRLKEISRRTTFKMAQPSVSEIALALAGQAGREVWVDGISSPGCG